MMLGITRERCCCCIVVIVVMVCLESGRKDLGSPTLVVKCRRTKKTRGSDDAGNDDAVC